MNERFELISRTPSKFYLAYGSNLDMERMGRRCPYAVPVGVTEIHGYRLLFKKSKTGSYAIDCYGDLYTGLLSCNKGCKVNSERTSMTI